MLRTIKMIKIQKAKLKDFPDIEQIYRFYVENTCASFEKVAPIAKELQTRWENDSRMPFEVAYLDDKVVGYAYVSAYSTRGAYSLTVENSVYVHPDYNGRGVGFALLKQLLSECGMQDIKQVIARIAIWDGSSASIKLHEKVGFKEVGRLTKVGYKFGEYIDIILMQKSL